MAEHSKIEWTDATWQPITGCSVVSPGCTNCYAMRLAGTRLQHHPSRAGLTRDTKAGPVWTGEVRLNEDWLAQPLSWRRPRKVFVCAHGDLFAEGVPDEWIDRIFAVMALAPQHIFQVLTKRPERMRDYLADPAVVRRIYDLACDLALALRLDVILIADASMRALAPPGPQVFLGVWPIPQIWLGVSVEDQRRADERIPILLDTPAAVRWISAEPLLGPVRLRENLGDDWLASGKSGERRGLDWVVVGSESGPNARTCNIDWVRSLRDQCERADVPLFWKQHMVNGKKISTPELDGRTWTSYPSVA